MLVEYQDSSWQKIAKQALAYKIYNAALRNGELVRPKKCSKCGVVGRIDGHHEDYDKPLDVTWLCQGCHKRRDVELSNNRETTDIELREQEEALRMYREKW